MNWDHGIVLTHCFHCFGRIWKFTVLTVLLRSQSVMKIENRELPFQKIPKQWASLPENSKTVSFPSRLFQNSELPFQIIPKQWASLPDYSKTVSFPSRFFQTSDENSELPFQTLPNQWRKQWASLPDSSRPVTKTMEWQFCGFNHFVTLPFLLETMAGSLFLDRHVYLVKVQTVF